MKKGSKELRMLRQELKSQADASQAEALRRYFKTGPGQYGEGDIFLGLKTPTIRAAVKKYKSLEMGDLELLLHSPIHEERSCALAILKERFKREEEAGRKELYEFYLRNTERINNWDLVDISAPDIVGSYLADKDRSILYELATSTSIWERRIAVLSTFSFIRQGDFRDALRIAEIVLHDEHDLLHKATGWMLREIGKRDPRAEEKFLDRHYRTMPRTALRYAIEKFPEEKRRHYMGKK
jgi:3-methyladenine DNA glycosylase AlkD